ncbi:vitamin B12/cobalamin outer membrane transporter, partial [Serratia quinivorans]
MSQPLSGSIAHKVKEAFRGCVRGYGYANRTAYYVNSRYSDPAHSDALPASRQLYTPYWATGLPSQEGIYASQLIYRYGHSLASTYGPLY